MTRPFMNIDVRDSTPDEQSKVLGDVTGEASADLEAEAAGASSRD